MGIKRDLIDREALINAYLAAHKGPPGGALKLIQDAPAVDAEPVKRGKWKGYLIPHWTKRYDDDGEPEYKYHTEYVCNICGYNSIIKHNYCPHCGAKMEVEG